MLIAEHCVDPWPVSPVNCPHLLCISSVSPAPAVLHAVAGHFVTSVSILNVLLFEGFPNVHITPNLAIQISMSLTFFNYAQIVPKKGRLWPRTPTISRLATLLGPALDLGK